MKFLQQNLTVDIAWTMASLMVLAISGIAINLLIGHFRDAAALGAFNLAYAVYMISSQITVFGCQYSVMRHVAHYNSDPIERDKLLGNAVLLALCLGFLGALILFAISPLLGAMFNSPAAEQAIRYTASGLLLFPLNKVLLGYFNGLRLMKIFSLLQVIRYLAVMLFVGSVAIAQRPFDQATLAFVVAETLTALTAILFLQQRGLLPRLSLDRRWIKQHLKFGGKSLLAGMFVEMNSRIDILMLGWLLDDRTVGIYSFSAMLVDGLYHVLSVVRLNFNPILVNALRDQQWQSAQHLLTRSKRLIPPATALLSLCTLTAFWLLTHFIIPSKGFQQGFFPLCLLLAGLTSISALIPFDNLLLVSGHPGWQTLQHSVVVLTNLLLGLLFIPLFGMQGAALATAISYLAGIAVLIILVRYLIQWDLLKNYHKV